VVKNKKKILVALDGSDQSFEAARYVSRLLPPDHSEVVLFHSFWDPRHDPRFRHRLEYMEAWTLDQERSIREFLDRTRRLFLNRGAPEDAVHVKVQQRKLGTARDVLDESQGNYDAVVAGRVGMSPLKDLLWGSVAFELIGLLTDVPLWVVGGAPEPGKILVATDATEESRSILNHLGNMMEGTDWTVSLVNVIRDAHLLRGRGSVEPEEAEKSVENFFAEAIAYLKKFGLRSDQITTKIITGVASRAKAIVDEARNGEYGTIVVGRRRLSLLQKCYIGRVSNKIMQLAKDRAVWVVN